MPRRFALSALLLGLVLIAAPASAQEFLPSGPPGVASDPALYDLAAITITQNSSSSLVTGTSVACGNATGTAENHFMRRFVFADHGVSAPFDVTQVDFGVDLVIAPAVPIPVRVRVYRIPKAAPLTFANLFLLTEVIVPMFDGLSLGIVPAPMAVTLDPATDDMVVSIFSPDLRGTGRRFFVGANSLGQTRPSYIAAPFCGANEPIPTAAIGYPGMHVFMAVRGSERPTPTASTTWGRVKTLYR